MKGLHHTTNIWTIKGQCHNIFCSLCRPWMAEFDLEKVLLLWNLTDVNPVILLCWSERINKYSILFYSRHFCCHLLGFQSPPPPQMSSHLTSLSLSFICVEQVQPVYASWRKKGVEPCNYIRRPQNSGRPYPVFPFWSLQRTIQSRYEMSSLQRDLPAENRIWHAFCGEQL
jgi:hypothetical protein